MVALLRKSSMTNLKALLSQSASDSQIKNNTNYVTFSYRPSEKVAAMIEVMNLVIDKPVNSLFTNQISENLVTWLLSDSDNIEYLDTFINSDEFKTDEFESYSGFMKILIDKGVIKKDYSQALARLDDALKKHGV